MGEFVCFSGFLAVFIALISSQVFQVHEAEKAATTERQSFTSTNKIDQFQGRLVPADKIGVLKRVEYVWSEGYSVGGVGLHSSARFIRPKIRASILVMEDGTHVTARGQVPDFAYGAPVYQNNTEHGLLSDYCIGHPLNDCFAPAAIHQNTTLTPRHFN